MKTISNEPKKQLQESFNRSKMMELFGAEITGIGKGYFEIIVVK